MENKIFNGAAVILGGTVLFTVSKCLIVLALLSPYMAN
jgi:hypothetical protein